MFKTRRAMAIIGAMLLAGSGITPISATAPAGAGPLVPGGGRTYQDADGWHIVGHHIREFSGSVSDTHFVDVRIFIQWFAGSESVGTAFEPILLDAVVGGTRTPWHVVVTDEFVGADRVEWRFALVGGLQTLFPVGGLELSPATTDGHSVSGSVENDSPLDAEGLVIHAMFRNADGGVVDAATSPVLPTLPAGASVPYAFAGNPNAEPAATVEVWAETTAGQYLTNWENFFGDLNLARFDEQILWLARERIVTGCNGGNFCAYRGVTRAQLAAFIDRAIELPNTDVDYFTDDDGHWAEDSINRLAEAGIVHGCAEGSYCPTGRVNRGQVAKFLVLAYDVPPSEVDAFTDDETSTTEAYQNALAAAGLSFGCNSFLGKYCPNRQLTRDEMAAFLYRAEHFEP